MIAQSRVLVIVRDYFNNLFDGHVRPQVKGAYRDLVRIMLEIS